MRGVLGIGVWIAAAVTAGWLWLNERPAARPLPGLAGPPATPIALPEAARVVAIAGALGEPVANGAVLVRFETADLDAELAVARAEHAAAQAQITAEQQRRIEARRATRTRLLELQAQARAAQGEARSRQAAAEAEARTLRRGVARIKKVAAEGLAPQNGLASLDARRARLRKEVQGVGEVLTPWAELQAAVDPALGALAAPADDPVVAAAQANAAVWAQRIQALEARRSRRVIHSPHAGRVLRVLRPVGSVANAGEPVLEFAPHASRRIRAWAPQAGARHWPVGQRVEVRSSDVNAAPALGTVIAHAPGMTLLPAQLWLQPNRPRHGRLLSIELDAPGFLTGEAVSVRPR